VAEDVRQLRTSENAPDFFEKVAVGPIDDPKSSQKPPKSVFWCSIWVRRGASQGFFNTLAPSGHLGD
jgi:hypothetical protein